VKRQRTDNDRSAIDALLKHYSTRDKKFAGSIDHLKIFDSALDTARHRRSWRPWLRWREQHPRLKLDLRGIHLASYHLRGIDLRGVRLDGATLARADLRQAHLEKASLVKANLIGAAMSWIHAAGADFSGGDLRESSIRRGDLRRARFNGASLGHANLERADFTGAKLIEAEIEGANLIQTRFDKADLTRAGLNGAILDGTSLLGTTLQDASVRGTHIRQVLTNSKTNQRSLVVDMHYVPERRAGSVLFTEVDDIRLAQFYDIIEEHGSVASLINAGSKRVVLILGRFLPRRKRVLDRLAVALQERGKIPVIFDFPGPEEREISDTVRFIAGMSQFIVVDMTKASSVPLELQSTIPDLMVPVLPIIESGHNVFAMFSDLQRRYFWVQPTARYKDAAQLVRYIDEAIIARAERAAAQIRERRAAAASRPLSVMQIK
jgi:Pentapeptide repeats (8 copies)